MSDSSQKTGISSTIGLVLALAWPVAAYAVQDNVKHHPIHVAQATFSPPGSDTNSNEKLRALAEPFEKLAEICFSATLPKIDEALGEARSASEEARGLLSTDVVQELELYISAMKEARTRGDRAELALSSIEVFRILVSSVTDDARVPNAVGLLDYAGFRYSADLKAVPIRWDDMARSVSFARENWAKILPKVTSSKIGTAVEKTLLDMENAVGKKRKSLAESSVKAELDLVDELEKYFSTPSGVAK